MPRGDSSVSGAGHEWRQRPVRGHADIGVVTADELHADVVSAGVEVFLHPRGDRLFVAPRDRRIDDAVAPTPTELLGLEPQPLEVPSVVGELQVVGRPAAGNRPGKCVYVCFSGRRCGGSACRGTR